MVILAMPSGATLLAASGGSKRSQVASDRTSITANKAKTVFFIRKLLKLIMVRIFLDAPHPTDANIKGDNCHYIKKFRTILRNCQGEFADNLRLSENS
jgi:hypothetical protein